MVGYMPWMMGCVQRPWGRVVSVGVLALMLVVVVCFSPVSGLDPSRMEIKVVDPGPLSVVSVTDGAVIRADGSVTFLTDPTYDEIPPLPAGHRWVAATRKGAIDETGALWILVKYARLDKTTYMKWTKYNKDRIYVGVSSTAAHIDTHDCNNRIFAIGFDWVQGTYLDLVTVSFDGWSSEILKDIIVLNTGRDPKHGDLRIDPPVPGWRSFIAGYDYGLAVSSDGRVFGVGNTADGQDQLRGRYTDVATATYVGNILDNRYSLGVTQEGGIIEFAGDDPNHIQSDIQAANLTHVRMVAAGPDRAMALTEDNKLYVFGNTGGWSKADMDALAQYRSCSSMIAAAPLHIGVADTSWLTLHRPDCLFVMVPTAVGGGGEG